MLTTQVALVPEDGDVDMSTVSLVSATLQKQVSRDVAPIWEISATVDAFPSLDDVPIGYWPITLFTTRDLGPAAGVHLDNTGQPFALVEFTDSWSLAASHECIEMLVDPFGNRVIAGPSPRDDQGRVEFPCRGLRSIGGGPDFGLYGQRHPGLRLLHATLLRPRVELKRQVQLHGRDHTTSANPGGRVPELARSDNRQLVAAGDPERRHQRSPAWADRSRGAKSIREHTSTSLHPDHLP